MASSLKSLLARPATIYGLVALAVMLPLLPPGHILTLDMALTPELPVPDITSSSFLFRLTLQLLNSVLPTDILEKLLFFAILMLSMLGMHRLISRTLPSRRADIAAEWGVYVASAMYAVNPFTYSRFMAGQYSVLLGYALLPLFAYALLDFLNRPGLKTSVPLIASTLGISIVSIHSLGLVAVLTAVALVATAWRYRRKSVRLRGVLGYSIFMIAVTTIASSYWLVPFIAGDSSAGQAAQSYGAGDRQAYATVGSGPIDRLVDVARLQGFWVEARNLYLLPQDFMPAWGLVVIGVWILVWKGAKNMIRGTRRYESFIFGGSGAIAAVVAAAGVSGWALRVLPALGGFREPHKFTGLVAMAFAYFIAEGIPVVVHQLKQKRAALAAVALSLILMLPVLWTPTMYGGFAGQLRPRHYPADWFVANERLNQDPGDFKVLFLPWHMYMHFQFAGRIIVNPAVDFFDKPVIVSNDPELPGSSLADQDPLKQKLSEEILPAAANDAELGKKLAEQGITYILLAKETDADKYSYLQHKKDVKLVYEGDALQLYRIEPREPNP